MFTSFISYRRTSAGSFALLLEDKMTKAGFSAFLDHKKMHRGRFDQEIRQTIDEVEDVIVLLSKDCFSPREGTDFYLEEIKYAMERGKNIILVTLNSYVPKVDVPPEEIKDILKYQGVSEPYPQDFEDVFLPKLASYLGETEEKKNYFDQFNARSYLSSRQKLEREPLDVRWANAVEIDICSYFANMLISTDYIYQALSNGAHIKYLIVDPDSAAAAEALKYRFKNIRKSLFRHSYDAALELYQDMKASNFQYFDESIQNGEFEVRQTTLHLDQAIMVVKKKKEADSSVKVDLYTFNTDDTNRRSIMIPYADRENYEFFCRQFDFIWDAPETKAITEEGSVEKQERFVEPVPEPIPPKPVKIAELRKVEPVSVKQQPPHVSAEDEGYVFISCKDKERAYGDSLLALFRENGIKTWIAPDDIPTGKSYVEAINRALKNCSCVVLLLSDAAQKSQWIGKEIERAVAYRKPIIPVMIEPVVLTDAFELMLSSSKIFAVQDFDRYSEEMKNVLEGVKAVYQPLKPLESAPEPFPPQPVAAPLPKPEPTIRSAGKSAGFAYICCCQTDQATADSLQWFLKQADIKTWMASDSALVGVDLVKESERMIENCSCFIFLLSEDAQESHLAAREMMTAIRCRKPIIPVQMRPVALNAVFELELSACQVITVQSEEDNKELLVAVKAALEQG